MFNMCGLSEVFYRKKDYEKHWKLHTKTLLMKSFFSKIAGSSSVTLLYRIPSQVLYYQFVKLFTPPFKEIISSGLVLHNKNFVFKAVLRSAKYIDSVYSC